jgi:hypothetical protein
MEEMKRMEVVRKEKGREKGLFENGASGFFFGADPKFSLSRKSFFFRLT